MADLLTILTATSPFWWRGLKWGAQVLVDAGKNILGDEVKKRTRRELKPILDRLNTPEAETAFDEAFKEATEAFLARYGAEEGELPKEVVELLSRGVEKGLDEASRDVLQSYLLTDAPRRAPLDRWVQRQLGGEAIVTREGRLFTQEEVIEALDIFFRELRRAFLGHNFFREEMFEVSAIQLLAEIRDGLLEQRADLEEMHREYLQYMTRRNEWIELRGIAPRVQGREVKMRMKDLFVPLQASPERDIREERIAELLSRVQETVEVRAPTDETLADIKGKVDVHTLRISLSLLPWDDPALESMISRRLEWRATPEAAEMKRRVGMAEMLAEERAVILGDPGTGKSTLLRYVAYAVAQNDPSQVGAAPLGRLPVLARIADFAKARGQDSTLSLVQYLREELEHDFAPLFRERLASGGCLVLLDGLDEVADPYQRGQVVGQIEKFIARYPNNRFVVTSRMVGYQQARMDAQFRHFELAPLPAETIADFVARWYEAIERKSGGELEPGEGRKQAEQLSATIQEHAGIQRLATNPLLLTIIALVNWRGRKLPNRRVELYQIAAETLIENWPLHQRGVQLDAEQVMTILAPVAYHIFATQAGEYISKGDLMPLLVAAIQEEQGGAEKEARETSEAMLATVSTQSGIFLERGYDEYGVPAYGFLHLTFAEYLTARYLAARWADDDMPVAEFCHIPRWREVVLLMVGHVGLSGRPQASAILRRIVDAGSAHEASLYRDLLLAGECLADDLRVKPEISMEIIERLVEIWIVTPISPLQDRVFRLFQAMRGTIHQREIESVLGKRLTDQNPDTRSSSAKSLGQLGTPDPRVVRLLRERLVDDDPNVQATAAEALAQLGAADMQTCSQLLGHLGNEQGHVGRRAADALGKIGASDPQIVPQLRDRLADENPRVRSDAASALGSIGASDPQIISQLCDRLTDEDPRVRSEAAKALSEIGYCDPQTVSVLCDCLEDTHWLVRYWSVRGLTETGASDPQTLVALRHCLADEDWRMRYTATYGVLQIGASDPETVAALRDRLADQNPHVRYGAARALGHIGASDPSTISQLRDRLDDENVDVRSNAARALARMGVPDPEAVSALHDCLDDEDWRVRYTAAYTLAQIAPSNPRTLPALREHLADGYWHTCAAYALAQVAPLHLHDISVLGEQLAESYWRMRCGVAHILLQIGIEFEPEPLFGLLDQITDVLLRDKSGTAYVLAQMAPPDPSPLSRWREWLRDEDWRVRDRAAYALAQAGAADPQTVSTLLSCLDDEYVDVRASAAYALGRTRIPDAKTVAALKHRLKDSEMTFFALRHVCDEAYASILALLEQAAAEPPLLEA